VGNYWETWEVLETWGRYGFSSVAVILNSPIRLNMVASAASTTGRLTGPLEGNWAVRESYYFQNEINSPPEPL